MYMYLIGLYTKVSKIVHDKSVRNLTIEQYNGPSIDGWCDRHIAV